MALISLDDLLTPLTADQVEASILAVGTKLGLKITAWQKGGVARTIIRVLATVYAAFTAIIALAVGGGFLDYAAGVWLTLLAKNVYNVTRIPSAFASAAQGITLTNAGGGDYLFEVGDLTFSATFAGVTKTYKNTSAGHLAPGPATTLTLDIQATEVGTASNAAPGDIVTMVTTFLGVSCSNGISVLGQDEEKDPELRERCRDSLGALSPNGPKAAYRFVAKSAVKADGSSIGITRVKIPTPAGDGSLTVLLATASGAVAGTVGDLTTDLGIVDDLIQNQVVPEGVGPVTVASAVVHPISISVDVYVDASAGLSTPAVNAAVNAALVAYFPTIPIGGLIVGTGKVFVGALEGVIRNGSPYFIKADITVPASDVTIAGNEVPTFSGTATVTVHQVTP